MARLSEVSKTAAAPKAVPVPNSVSQNSPVTTVVTAATTPATPIAFQELTELREKAKQVDDSAQKAKEAEEAKQKALTDKQTAEQQAEQLRKDAETLQNQLDDAKQRADFQEEQANANLDRAQDAEKALRKAEENLDNTADDWQRKLESKEADRRALEVELKGDDETTGLRDELRIAKRRANNAKSKFHATLAVGSIVAALLLVFTIVLAVSNSGLKKDVQWYIDEYESGEQLPSLDDDNTTDPASVVTEPPAETEQPAATKAPATPQTETWALNPTLASGIGETGPGGSYAFTDSDGKTYRPIGLNAGKAFVDADGNAARDKLIAAFGISQKITVKGGFEVKDALSSGATVVLLEQSGDTKAELSDGLAVIVVQPDGTAYNGTLIAVQ